MTRVKTSSCYPQSNGKIERRHKTLKGDCIRVQVPLSLDDARRLAADYVAHYDHVRLHSAIGYVAPKGKLDGRDRKLAEARERRKRQRREQHERQSFPAATAAPPAIDFAAVRAAITMAAVLELLGFQTRRCRGTQQRGACPLHGSASGASCRFSANLNQQTFPPRTATGKRNP